MPRGNDDRLDARLGGRQRDDAAVGRPDSDAIAAAAEGLRRGAGVIGQALQLPREVNGRQMYMASPDYMGKYAKRLIHKGVKFLGGCCGTTPEHIEVLAVLAVWQWYVTANDVDPKHWDEAVDLYTRQCSLAVSAHDLTFAGLCFRPAPKQKFEFPVKWGMDLQSEHERYLTEEVFKKPVTVTDYPADIKAFYMRLNEDGKTVRAMAAFGIPQMEKQRQEAQLAAAHPAVGGHHHLRFRVVDTGGIIPDDKDFIPAEIFRQARIALDEADVIVMVHADNQYAPGLVPEMVAPILAGEHGLRVIAPDPSSEIDHAKGGPAAWWNLDYGCSIHHRRKTQGWKLGPRDLKNGKRTLSPPAAVLRR